MRHRAPRPFADSCRHLLRATPLRLARVAGRRPVRILATLMVVLSLGIGGFVALASVLGGSASHRAAPAAPAEAGGGGASHQRREPSTDGDPAPATTPAPPSAAPTTGHAPLAPPAGEPPPSARADRSRSRPSADAVIVGPSATPPQPSATVSASPEDSTPPDTTLLEDFPLPDLAVFRLTATEPATFSCSLDGAGFTPCDSSTRYQDLEPGWHTLAVRAVDAAGNVDPSPAETRWLTTPALPGTG